MEDLLSPVSHKRVLESHNTIVKGGKTRKPPHESIDGDTDFTASDSSIPGGIVFFDTAERWKQSENGKEYIRIYSPVNPKADEHHVARCNRLETLAEV